MKWTIACFVGMMTAGAGPVWSQGLYLAGARNGPELGLVIPLAGGMSLEPGLYVSWYRYHVDMDSSDNISRELGVGLAARLRWAGDRDALVSPALALRISAGKVWNRQDYDYVSPSFSAQTEFVRQPMQYTAGLHAGANIRVSERVSLSVDYDLTVLHQRGTQQQDQDYSGPFAPPSSSRRESYRQTYVSNGFSWAVRLHRRRG